MTTDKAPVHTPEEAIAVLVAMLNTMTEHYVELAGCGDCGHWNPEEEEEVIAARSVIAKYRDLSRVNKGPAADAMERATEKAEAAIARVIEGDGGMVPDDVYRNDGRLSKLDRCVHGRAMYEGCETCAEAVLDPALTELRQALAAYREQSNG